MAAQVGIMKTILQAFVDVDDTRLNEVTTTIQTLLAVKDNKFLYSLSFFITYFNGEVKKDVGLRATERQAEVEKHTLLTSLKGHGKEKLSLSLVVAYHGAIDALVEVFREDPTLCITLEELDANLKGLCQDPYDMVKQTLTVKALRVFFKSIIHNPKVNAIVKEKAELMTQLLDSIGEQPVLKVILQKLDTIDFDELLVASYRDPTVLITALSRQVLIPVLHNLFTKIPLKPIHVDISEDGTDTLDVSEMVLVVPEFPDAINTRTEIDNIFIKNPKNQYEHSEMKVKLYVGVTNVPCEIKGTKFDFNRRSFPRIQRDGHLDLTVTGMDVGVSINVNLPTPTKEVLFSLGGVSASEATEPSKKSPTQETKEKEKEKKDSGEIEQFPVSPSLPTIRCDDPQLFKLHGFSLEFQDDVKNAELLNTFSSTFEREICFGVSKLVADQLAEIMKEACVHMTSMVRLATLQSWEISNLVSKEKIVITK
eukprot:TRINITY_DN13192_c0_g1_i1.p1 TRINITY_DN13192_c0_g1~~TRINITY_DN13192_c0_g1_i1.p1  ORF type:complete len:488 (+),score=120.28 TRINITY_DN13192_c0_g1_i1:22-1464(+)